MKTLYGSIVVFYLLALPPAALTGVARATPAPAAAPSVAVKNAAAKNALARTAAKNIAKKLQPSFLALSKHFAWIKASRKAGIDVLLGIK